MNIKRLILLALSLTVLSTVGWGQCSKLTYNPVTGLMDCIGPAAGTVNPSAGVPVGACTAGAIVYNTLVTPYDFYLCGPSATWQRIIATQDTVSGKICLPGITSGQACITVKDIANTPNDIVLPISTGPAGGIFVTDGGSPQQTSFLSSTFVAQTDGSTVTWAIGSAVIANASLTFTTHGGNRTLNITGPINGGSYVLWVKQDSTGGEGLILGTGCTWKVSGGGSGAITTSTGASAIDVLAFTYDGTNCYANFNKNFN